MSQPISIALPLKPGPSNARAWAAPPTRSEPIAAGEWIGDVGRGGSVNFAELHITPHGAGTHTESVAHISRLSETNHVAAVAPRSALVARLIDVPIRDLAERGRVADLTQLRDDPPDAPVLLVRALGSGHVDGDFTGTDPPYFLPEDMDLLAESGVQHLVTDLPSLDRESDGGRLLAHRAFWKFPGAIRAAATVTELARLNHAPGPGLYLITFNVLPLHADASPSVPILYALSKVVRPPQPAE